MAEQWGNWWFAIVMVAVAVVHEVGLRARNANSTRANAKKRRLLSWLSLSGMVVLTLSVISPIEYWSMQYFWVHMIQHVLVMLAAPALYVAGAPWLNLVRAVPVGLRRKVLRRSFGPGRHPLRWLLALLVRPVVAVVLFNVVMVAWMLPALFNPVMNSEFAHISLMLTSFALSGTIFWLQFIPSFPFKPQMSPGAQVIALLGTNLVMTIIAIALSFFSSGASYTFMGSMTDMNMVMPTLNPLADQRIGAAILWVCGDLWCYPALIVAIRRAMREDKVGGTMDRVLRRSPSMSADEFTAAREARIAAQAGRAPAPTTSH